MAMGDDVLSDMQESTEAILKDYLGVSDSKATEAARKIREYLRGNWGGQVIYFKKKKDVSDRNEEIYDKFNGDNVSELSVEYDLSMQMVYRILKSVKAGRTKSALSAGQR